MLLKNLLPRDLDPENGTETVTLLNGLIARIHLDRRLSRRLGWRGVKPSFAQGASWTIRIAGTDQIFGLAFMGEDCVQGLVAGRFAVYMFPPENTPEALRGYGIACTAKAAVPEFRQMVRELTLHQEEFADFICGEIELVSTLKGDGIALTMTSDLVSAKDAFRRISSLFAVLVQSLMHETGEKGELVLNLENSEEGGPVASITWAAGGFVGRIPGRRLKKLYRAHKPRAEEMENLPVVHIVTGFLGAGKTTFVRQWLEYLNGRERFTGVIQNEFGEIDLDSLVLKGQTKVEALEDGCVCCSLSDSLRPGLMRLIETTPAEQFILETTGVADPVSVSNSLLVLNDIVRRGLVITIVDSLDLSQKVDRLNQAEDENAKWRMAQILNADVIVCTKADMVEHQSLDKLMQRLHVLNDKALIVHAVNGAIPFAVLDTFYYHWLDTRGSELPSRGTPRQVAAPSAGIFSKGFGSKNPVQSEATDDSEFERSMVCFDHALEEWELTDIVARAGKGLCRAKGIVEVAGEGMSVVHFASGLLSYEPADEDMLEKWRETGNGQAAGAKGFIVFIGRNLGV